MDSLIKALILFYFRHTSFPILYFLMFKILALGYKELDIVGCQQVSPGVERLLQKLKK